MLTTHDMEDIEALCSRVMVLGHGKKLFDGKLQDLLERYDTVRNVNIKYDGELADLRLPEGIKWKQTEDGIELSYNPIDVYPLPLRALFTVIAPFALTMHVPASWILDKPLYGWPVWTAFVTPLAGAVVFAVMTALFHLAMRHYRSTGS